MGIGKEDQTYTTSISFRKPPHQQPRVASELAMGNLDDLLIISFGIGDKTSHFVEVGLEEVLRGHQLCEDILTSQGR